MKVGFDPVLLVDLGKIVVCGGGAWGEIDDARRQRRSIVPSLCVPGFLWALFVLLCCWVPLTVFLSPFLYHTARPRFEDDSRSTHLLSPGVPLDYLPFSVSGLAMSRYAQRRSAVGAIVVRSNQACLVSKSWMLLIFHKRRLR